MNAYRMTADEARFAEEFSVRLFEWSEYTLSRMANLTGERPERAAELKEMIRDLDRYDSWADSGRSCGRCLTADPIRRGGVFDHGDMWGRNGIPWAIVGQPYQINERQYDVLVAIGRFTPGIKVHVNDRPSYYGYGTSHVRIELVDPLPPYRVPRSTRLTRSVAAKLRSALREEMDGIS